MAGLFVTVLNMSIGASACILAVMLLRLLLHRAPKVFSYLLWAMVLVRLICPVLPKAGFGIVPDVELYKKAAPLPKEAAYAVYLAEKAGQIAPDAKIPEENEKKEGENVDYLPAENILIDRFSPNAYGRGIQTLAMVWALAAFGLVTYAVASYGIFMRHIKNKKISTPFVAGLVRPVIYLPENLDDVQKQLVEEHERIHIRRLDYLVKPLAFLVCCVHWFNPLVWAAFFLMERDMEASCDEAVIRKVGYDKRKDYANVLLGLSQSRGWRAGYPIAFGENHVKSRIKGVVKMKKAGIGVVIGAAVLVMAATLLLLVNRSEKDRVEPEPVKAEDQENDKEMAEASGTAQPSEMAQPPGGEIEESEPVEIPDLKMQEYYTAEELLKDNDLTYISESEAAAGSQETIMNYDPNRERDQYDVILLPQPDEAFNDIGILFSYPVEGAKISDGFGGRVHPVSGDILYHLGIDFAAEAGTPIMAAADGTVVKTGFDNDCGNYVILLHENGDATYYCQCKEILTEEGKKVMRGEQIATVGSTGKSTGAHLHFAVSRNGKFVEPEFEEGE